MGDEKDTWKVKTLDEILQEKKRRKEQEEKGDSKHRNVSLLPCASINTSNRCQSMATAVLSGLGRLHKPYSSRTIRLDLSTC